MVNNLIAIMDPNKIKDNEEKLRTFLNLYNLLGTVFEKDSYDVGKNYIEYRHCKENSWCVFDYYMKIISANMPDVRIELERLDFDKGMMCFVYKDGQLIDVMGGELSWYTIDDWEDIVAKVPEFMGGSMQ